MNREIYASNQEYFLCRLSEADRENYVELHRQLNGDGTLFLNPYCKDIMWEQALNGMTQIYSIFDSEEKYCGSIELQNPEDKHPEIGIDIMKECRNKGIAPKIVKLFAQMFYSKNQIEYFLVRISSRNYHSKHVFEKLGVIFWGEEKGRFELFMDSYKKIMKCNDMEDIEEKYRELFGEEEGEVIYKYKYLPEAFWN